MKSVQIDAIRTDGGTQMRAGLDDAVVAEYAQIVRDGSDFPPVKLFFDGTDHWLADGFHRFFAYKAAGAVELPADIEQGTKRDAILFSVGANASHGLRRTNEDKRKAVLTLLNDEEWAGWSDREIARHANVTHPFVAKQKAERAALTGNVTSEERSYTTKHGTTATMDTANIGGVKVDKEAAKQERQVQQAENDRVREEHRAALPPEIQRVEAAKDANRQKTREARAANDDALSPEDRIAELEEAVRVLEAENATLKAEVKLFGEMKAEWEKGGFAEVVAGKDEVIRSQAARIESESHEKVKNLRSADHWRKEAVKLGYQSDEVIPVKRRKAHA